jgi:hypothetical protein
MVAGVDEREGLMHRSPSNDPAWLETNWFSFLVPERNMRGHVYTGFRTNLGVVFSSILIWSRDTASVVGLDYYDARVHLPMPAGVDLDDYELENGLRVRMDEPLRHWTVTYSGMKGVTLEMDVEALMPAVSSHDTRLPDGADFSHFHQVDPAAYASVGHLDQTQMVRGHLVLDGERIDFAHPTNHDHSWSPRPEFGHGYGYFDEGYFGEDFAFHVMTKNTEAESAPVTNGYILDHGEVLALKAGVGRYELDGWVTRRLVYELEDERGRTHVFTGEPTAVTVLPTWPNQFNIAAVVRWTCGGDVGWGEYKWHWETTEMQRHHGGAGLSAISP